MPKRLQTRDPGFEAAFAAFLGEKREASEDVDAAVAAILADVRTRGDAALIELTQKFDRVDLGKVGLRVTRGRDRAAREACTAETLEALQLAADRIAEHHERQLPIERPLHRRAWRRARLALDGGRIRRPLRAGRASPATRAPC